MTGGLASMAGFAPVAQRYLLQARQMQALSFAVHIPLVCFGIALPVLVLFAEGLYLRSGDPLYRTLAQRWSRVMVTLFAFGVITGTVLSFEMGLLWPNFTGTFGSVFGLGFAIEGFSFFLEAIFIGIYVYGWGRLAPRAHLLSGIPIVFTGFTGSLMVISVNAWMNHPGGFRLHGGRVFDIDPFKALFENTYLWHELIHMYVAAYVVTGFILAAVYAFGRLRGRWGRYERTAVAIALTVAALASIVQGPVGDWAARDVAKSQPTKLAAIEGLPRTTRGAPRAPPRLVRERSCQVRDRHPPPALGAGIPQLGRAGPGLGRRACRPATTGERGAGLVSDDGRNRNLPGADRAGLSARVDPAQAASPVGLVLPGPGPRGPAFGRRADRRVGGYRGRSTALGRLPGDANRRGDHRRPRDSRRLRRARLLLCGGGRRSCLGVAASRARAARFSARCRARVGNGVG